MISSELWSGVLIEGRLSYGQKGLWFLERLDPEGAYNIGVAARVRGRLDVAALRWALERLVERHDALRTVFPAEGGEPVRRVLDRMEVDFQEIDLPKSAWSAERLAEEAYRPFSLEHGPLLRVRLLGPVILLSIHHIVADFASLAIIARDLGALYQGDRYGESLPPVSASYGDFVRWQEEMLAGRRGERSWEYWRETLAGVPDLDLPADRPRPPVQTWRGWSRALEIPAAEAEAVRSLAAGQGATLFTALMAAFQVQLGRYSGQRDFAVGSPTAGRGPVGSWSTGPTSSRRWPWRASWATSGPCSRGWRPIPRAPSPPCRCWPRPSAGRSWWTGTTRGQPVRQSLAASCTSRSRSGPPGTPERRPWWRAPGA